VIRLWHRIGVFRMLAVGVLVLGVVAGIHLSAARQSQQRVVQAAQDTASVQDEQRQLHLMTIERLRISAASRSAQREAQAKADAAASAAAAQAKAAEEAARKNQPKKPVESASTKAAPPFGPIPTSCAAYTGNVAIGCALLLEAGFPISEMTCLKPLWMKESGWRVEARNPIGAGGIPQANPFSKIAAFGADYKTNPKTQINWGLNYIKGKYKTPCAAWSVWQSKGWY
jgi:hypothetical protein